MTLEATQLEYGDALMVHTAVTRQAMHIRLAPLRDLGWKLSVRKVPGGYLVRRVQAPHRRVVQALQGRPRSTPVIPAVSILDLL
jgi:hypothetical protein